MFKENAIFIYKWLVRIAAVSALGLATCKIMDDWGLGQDPHSLLLIMVGLSGCLRGMQAGKSAEAVGQATTSAVVTGITLIIVCNFIIDFVITMMGL